jgi:hypothetical protein
MELELIELLDVPMQALLSAVAVISQKDCHSVGLENLSETFSQTAFLQNRSFLYKNRT